MNGEGRDDEAPSDEALPFQRPGANVGTVTGNSNPVEGAPPHQHNSSSQGTSSGSDETFYSFPPSSPSEASSTASATFPSDYRLLREQREPLFNSDENITVVIRGEHYSPSSLSPDTPASQKFGGLEEDIPGAETSQTATEQRQAQELEAERSLPIIRMPIPSYPHPLLEHLAQAGLSIEHAPRPSPTPSPRPSVYVIPGEAITSDDISPSSRHPLRPRPFTPESPERHAPSPEHDQHAFRSAETLASPHSQVSVALRSDETLRPSPTQEGDGDDSGEDLVPEMKEAFGEVNKGSVGKVPLLRRKSPINRTSIERSKEAPGSQPESSDIPPPSNSLSTRFPLATYSSDPWYSHDIVYDRDEELAVIRILDTRLLPWILLSLFVLSMDRTNHSNAVADNLPQDLGFNIDTVNIGAAIHSTFFFVFCLVGAVAAKMVGPARWIPILMFSWGLITVAHAFIRNRRDYLAVRSWIAITEAGVIPAILVYFGRFYKGNEFATRLAYLWSVQMIGSAVSGLAASGLLHLRGIFKREGWRWLFLIDGVITLALAILTWFYLPRNAATTRGGLRGRRPWFTDRQVQISVTRVVRDDIAKRRLDKPITWADAVDTFTDLKIWIHVLNTTIGLTPMTSLHTYFPLTIKNFNFNVFAANALTAPPHFLQAISTILLIRHSDRVRERGLHGAFGTAWQLVGWFLLLFLPSETPKVVKYFAAVIVASYPAVHPLNVAWMAENAGTIGKRTIATGAMSGFSAIHGTWGSQIYRADDAPDFRRGNTINIVFVTTALGMWFLQKYYYTYLNKKHANKYAEMTPEEREQEELLQEAKGNSSVLFRFTS